MRNLSVTASVAYGKQPRLALAQRDGDAREADHGDKHMKTRGSPGFRNGWRLSPMPLLENGLMTRGRGSLDFGLFVVAYTIQYCMAN